MVSGMENGSGRIVIGDAEASFRCALAGLLREAGYTVTEAAAGPETLGVARKSLPDAVLLAVDMPGLNGYELCARLKADPETAAIPVLLLAAPTARQDHLNGMAAGADDYLSKPLDPEEALLRVRNAVRLRALARQSASHAGQIKELESVRDELTQLIVRDMRTPLAGLAGLLELADRAAVKHLDGEASFYLNEALGATETLEEMVDSLMDVRRLMAGELKLALQPCDVYRLAGGCVDLLKDAAVAAGVSLEVAGDPAPSACDEALLRRVLQHLLRHGIKRSARGQTVGMSVRTTGDRIQIEVTDHGRALTAEELELMRQGFRGQLPPAGKPTSGQLGFTFCRMVVQAHGGDIDLVSAPQATTLRVRIPVGSVAATAPAAPDPLPQQDDRRSRRYIADRGRPNAASGMEALSLVTLDTRARFAVAVALMSVLPLLAFMFMVVTGIHHESVSLMTFYLVTPVVVILVVLGMVLLARHRQQVERLRRYLEVMARGGAPNLAFGDEGEDFAAIEQSLGAVIRQTDDRVRVIEAQSHALVQAEQQRVMIETLGAACHHLGQPATVIRVYLEMMQKKEASPEIQRMIEECQQAAESVSEILRRLQGVAKYQTEPYLPSRSGDDPAPAKPRILKI